MTQQMRKIRRLESELQKLQSERDELLVRVGELMKLKDSADRCGLCGSTIYSGPPDCPGCGAPICCQSCCRIQNLEDQNEALRKERDDAAFWANLHEEKLKNLIEVIGEKSDDAMFGKIAEWKANYSPWILPPFTPETLPKKGDRLVVETGAIGDKVGTFESIEIGPSGEEWFVRVNGIGYLILQRDILRFKIIERAK